MQNDDAARIAARYPSHQGRRPGWIALAVVLGTVLLAWLVWAGMHYANPAVDFQVKSFRVLDDTGVEATITVQRPDPSKQVVCTLLADDESHRRVGEVVTTVPPASSEIVEHTVTLTTLNRATVVTIEGCRVG